VPTSQSRTSHPCKLVFCLCFYISCRPIVRRVRPCQRIVLCTEAVLELCSGLACTWPFLRLSMPPCIAREVAASHQLLLLSLPCFPVCSKHAQAERMLLMSVWRCVPCWLLVALVVAHTVWRLQPCSGSCISCVLLFAYVGTSAVGI
jgi:hypothetical protein